MAEMRGQNIPGKLGKSGRGKNTRGDYSASKSESLCYVVAWCGHVCVCVPVREVTQHASCYCGRSRSCVQYMTSMCSVVIWHEWEFCTCQMATEQTLFMYCTQPPASHSNSWHAACLPSTCKCTACIPSLYTGWPDRVEWLTAQCVWSSNPVSFGACSFASMHCMQLCIWSASNLG